MIYKTIQEEKVPALGMGTWQIDGQECAESVEQALEIGYRHIDTAQIYGNEEEVGRGIQNSGVDRSDIFLTTKVARGSLDAASVRSTTEESLRKLGTDHVDLLLQHWPHPNDEVPLEETLDALRALQEEGKTQYIGVSNFTPSLLQRALDYAKFFCLQVEYHPLLDQRELLEMAQEHDLLLTAYSPLARGKVFENDVLQEIGDAHGKSPGQVSLRWLVQQDNVAAIPKASSQEHRRSNFDVFDFELSEEEMERISGLGSAEGRVLNPDFGPDWENG